MRAPTIAGLTGASNDVLRVEAERGRAIDEAYDIETDGGLLVEEQRHWVVRVQGWEAHRRIDF